MQKFTLSIQLYVPISPGELSTFNPLIVTKDAESAIALFENLCFERHHTKGNIGIEDVTDIRMKDPNGFYVDISQGHGEYTMIRMNVDNLEEAVLIPSLN